MVSVHSVQVSGKILKEHCKYKHPARGVLHSTEVEALLYISLKAVKPGMY